MQAWPFSGQPFSGPPSYRPTAPRPSDPARPGMGSVRSVIHSRFRSSISHVPFSVNLLSRKGSPGCSLCCVHEASDYPISQRHSRRKGEAGYWRGSTVCTIGRLEGEWDQRNRIRQAKSEPLVGLAPRRESSNVCVGGLTTGYEAHRIGRPIRKTHTGIEGSGNARRRRAEGALAQPLWHAAPAEDSPLSPDRGGCSPTAGECTGRTQTFAPPPANAGCQRPGNSPTLTALPKPTS